MGVVYLARDTWLDRPVALKVAPEQEQAAGGALITTQSDIYALATAFEVLTGRAPFTDEDRSEVRLAHLHRAPVSVSSVCPELAPFDAALARALAKAPSDRFKSCDAFATALLEAGEDRSMKTASLPPLLHSRQAHSNVGAGDFIAA
jgi:eukaryotic-like serine/threonine-protein kinase